MSRIYMKRKWNLQLSYWWLLVQGSQYVQACFGGTLCNTSILHQTIFFWFTSVVPILLPSTANSSPDFRSSFLQCLQTDKYSPTIANTRQTVRKHYPTFSFDLGKNLRQMITLKYLSFSSNGF